MKRWKAICAYDGTDWEGWQSQPSGKAIQDLIERRLKVIFGKQIRIHGSGRTDAGVHAKGQVFHFDGLWEHTVEELLRAFRCGLPGSIQVSSVQEVDKDFHARFSAKKKRYAYNLYMGYATPLETRYTWSLKNWKPDVGLMREAAEILLGRHDFSAFAVSTGVAENKQNPVKDLQRLDVSVKGAHIRVVTEADGYLYKMVRSLVGALVDVGIERLTIKEIKATLKSKKRTHRIRTAPAEGLCLEHVYY